MNTKKMLAEMKSLPKTLDMAILKGRVGAYHFFMKLQHKLLGMFDKDLEVVSRMVNPHFEPLALQYIRESSLFPRPIKNTRAFYRYIKACVELGNEMGDK